MPGQFPGARPGGRTFTMQAGGADQLAKHGIHQPCLRRAEQQLRLADRMVDNPRLLPFLSGDRTSFKQLKASDEEDRPQPDPRRMRNHRPQNRIQPSKIPNHPEKEMLTPGALLPVCHARRCCAGRLLRRMVLSRLRLRPAAQTGPRLRSGLLQQGVDSAASFSQRSSNTTELVHALTDKRIGKGLIPAMLRYTV